MARQPSLSDLSFEDGVQFVETQTAQPSERPLVVRGDWLKLSNVAGTATVSGRPARDRGPRAGIDRL